MLRIRSIIASKRIDFTKHFTTNMPSTTPASNRAESERMKRFHEKLSKAEKPSRFGIPSRLSSPQDLLLVDTNPESGELIANSEKEPTKWGDWQHKGRVTDF